MNTIKLAFAVLRHPYKQTGRDLLKGGMVLFTGTLCLSGLIAWVTVHYGGWSWYSIVILCVLVLVAVIPSVKFFVGYPALKRKVAGTTK